MTLDIQTILELLRNYGVVALVAGILFGYIIKNIFGNKILGLIGGILIALVILLVPYLDKPTCSSCGADKEYGQNYCSVCGEYGETENIFGKIKCDNCSRHISKDSNVCGYCGDEVT